MRTIVAIVWVELRRFFADRSNLFFVLIFPLAMVAVIGVQFGSDSGAAPIAVSGPQGPARTALVQGWEEADLVVTVRDDVETLREDVSVGSAEVGVVLSADAAAAYQDGVPLDLEIITGASAQATAVAQIVTAQAEAVAVEATQVRLLGDLADEGQARDALRQAGEEVPEARLLVREPRDPIAQAFDGAGQFDTGATAQLLLFVFISTLSASAALIKARRDGVIRRTLAAPVSTRQTMTGLTLSRVLIALAQGGYIMIASTLLFGVQWGDLRVTLVVLLAFSLIAAGAAMVIGVVVDNEGAASGVSVGLGLVLGAIGGAMVPLELYGDTLRSVAHLTPHAWAYDALAEIQRRGAGISDIVTELTVLLAMAVTVLLIGSLLLRRSLDRAM